MSEDETQNDPLSLATKAAENAAADCPGLAIDVKGFASFLSARLTEASGSVFAADLALAWAAAQQQHPAAIQSVRALLADAARQVLRSDSSGLSVDDLTSDLAERLLVGDAKVEPRLLRYRGEAPLSAFLRASVMRAVIQAKRRVDSRQYAEPDELAEAAVESTEADLALARSRHRDAFRAAFEHALQQLSTRERTVLRLNVRAGLSIDKLAVIYSVHRASVARWLSGARETLLFETRKHLAANLALPQSELSSFMRIAASGVDLSVRRLLDSDAQ